MKTYSLFSDGGARGNPGPAAIGVVCYLDTQQIWTIKEYIGATTNNQAEYRALIAGLEKAQGQIDQLVCYLDSELVVKQLRGEYRVKDKDLQPLARRVLELMKDFTSIEFQHIPREENQVADSLVNQALDQHIANS